MPDRSRQHDAARCPAGAVLCVLLTALLASTGCRVFRCHKASEESIAAARQLSLAGLDAEQRGQWERAESLFAAAILKCPTDERARCGFAEALWRRGARADAVAHMQEAARLSGHDPERLVRLGEMYRALGNVALAERQVELAIAANPQLASAWALRGHLARGRGDGSEALASYHRALSYQQSLPDVQLAIGQLYLEQQRPQRALATLQSLAASYAPGEVPTEVLLFQGIALRSLERPQDAARVLAVAAQRVDSSVELLYELALAQHLTGDILNARQAVAAALRREPQHAGCLALAQQLSKGSASVAAAEIWPVGTP